MRRALIVLICMATVFAVVGCGSGKSAKSSRGARARSAQRLPSLGGVPKTASGRAASAPVGKATLAAQPLGRLNWPSVYPADGSLYVVSAVGPPGDENRSNLIRANSAATTALAALPFNGDVDGILATRKALLVTTNRGATTWLLWLNPVTLAVRSQERLPGTTMYPEGGSMALAGGWLWITHAGSLDRVSLTNEQVTAVVPVMRAGAYGGLGVAANPSGTVLLDSEGEEISRVQRRNPSTGALIAQSPPLVAVSPPSIDGIFGPWVWVSQAGGMMGDVNRLDLRTLSGSPFARADNAPTGPEVWGTNAIRAQVVGSVLWVAQVAGGQQRNYCGSPITGRSGWAPRPLSFDGQFLAATAKNFYYDNGDGSPYDVKVIRAAITASCRA
jgi:hypothetical protein